MSTTPNNPLLGTTRQADRLRALQRYWTPLRLTDWFGGHRDGRRGLPEGEETPQLMHRLAAQSREGCQSVRRSLDRHSAPLVKQLYALTAELEQADDRMAEMGARLSDLPAEPGPAELSARGPAESEDDDAVVAARARRRHTAALQSARAAVSTAVEHRRGLAVAIDQVRADLDALHALAATQALRIVEHHQRRIHVYLRALVRRHPDRARVVGLFDRHPLTPPEWATGPCPWTTGGQPPRTAGEDRHLSLA
jgi:hypothetical protein